MNNIIYLLRNDNVTGIFKIRLANMLIILNRYVIFKIGLANMLIILSIYKISYEKAVLQQLNY